ncbi:hypothetical protein SAMN02745219_03387 [Desulfofundulus thermosubterraneus DSM 16057]|uniref:Uncharacterized protein n=1 Tax=Desulfofundulus thermosubterraneus DSM 16057 TaxID=1121432 RepID=A0A1M6MB47_9FIRM|nr:hypothetical protein SAMN02745219_03387 [Desulfofundulus thermosubterraneus DSM 16057]
MLLMEHVSSVVEALARVRSLCVQFGWSASRRWRFIKANSACVSSSPEERAKLVRGMYAARDRAASKLLPDRREAVWWCFYVS